MNFIATVRRRLQTCSFGVRWAVFGLLGVTAGSAGGSYTSPPNPYAGGYSPNAVMPPTVVMPTGGAPANPSAAVLPAAGPAGQPTTGLPYGYPIGTVPNQPAVTVAAPGGTGVPLYQLTNVQPIFGARR